MARYTNLGSSTASFNSMMTGGFGVVTVMNADVYAYDENAIKGKTVAEILTGLTSDAKLCTIDTLKVANVTVEGPTKTITGGQYSNPLIKFGKTARLEMQDALGKVDALEALCGTVNEWTGTTDGSANTLNALHVGSEFAGAKTIVGDSFFIDRKTGEQVKVKIIFFQFLPDSLFNLTQDAEGDATVFDLNGDLLATDIKTFNNDGKETTRGMFYSIVDPNTKVTDDSKQ